MNSIDVKRGERFQAKESLRIAFLLDKSHLRAAGQVLDAFRQFVAFADDIKRYLINDPMGDWDEVDDSRQLVDLVDRRLFSAKREPNCSLIVLSDDANISDYSFTYAGFNLDDPEFAQWASAVTIHLPTRVLHDRAPAVQAFFMTLLAALPAFVGYANLAIQGEQEILQRIARRHPGVDISSVSSVVKDIGRKAPGAFWLNAYRGELADSVRAELAQKMLPEGARTASLDGGEFLVLLSPEPQRLTVGRDGLDAALRWLATLLDSFGGFHVPRRVVYFEDEDDLEDADAQRAWHGRFLAER